MIRSLFELQRQDNNSSKHFTLSKSSVYHTKIYQREIDEGLWLFASQLDCTKNVVNFNLVESIHNDYYFLAFCLVENMISFKGSKEISLMSNYWTLSKPNTKVFSYFNKGTKAEVFIFAFNKQWAIKNLSSKNKNGKSVFNFLDVEKGFYKWLDIFPDARFVVKPIIDILDYEDDIVGERTDLKKKGMKLINGFFENSFSHSGIFENHTLSNLHYQNVSKAEKIILENLHLPFVGIEYISKEVNTSPTKLKSNFKSVFGFSMLQYHKERNLLLALQLIQKSEITIQNIANLTGYESASRFASGFKKRFGKLPSQVRLEA
jgi:AraC-like DNA-binding protein